MRQRITATTYLLQLAHLLQGSVHPFLHNGQFLFLLFDNSAKFVFLLVQLVKQIIDLKLLRLCREITSECSLEKLDNKERTLRESSNSVSCRLYFESM